MFYFIRADERPTEWVALSWSADWLPWLGANIPQALQVEVKRRLKSNLKHLLVGLEMKAALIEPHGKRGRGERGVLFEPYFQNLIQEFCVGTYSVLEGLGAAHWLEQNGNDGALAPRIGRLQWGAALSAVYDPEGESGLAALAEEIADLRDRLHQDRLGAREDIDWHAFSYDDAYAQSKAAIQIVLSRRGELVPERSNLMQAA